MQAQCWEGAQLQDSMPSRAATQVGWVPEEAELIDDYAHECAQDRDEQKVQNLVVDGEGQASIPDPVLACMLVGVPAHGPSEKIFALTGTLVNATLHIGRVTLVPAFHCFPQVGLVNVYKLAPVPDRAAEESDVARVYTPMTRTGQFCRVLLELAPTKRTILRPHHVAAWDAGVDQIELELLEFDDPRCSSSEPDQWEEGM